VTILLQFQYQEILLGRPGGGFGAKLGNSITLTSMIKRKNSKAKTRPLK
jgi:hypothetical protein